MFGRFFVYPLFRFLFDFCCFFLKTQKYQKYFRCFSWFVSFLWFVLKEKSKNIFLCLVWFVCFCLFFLCLLVSKKSITPKIFVVLLWFCEFFAGFSRPQWI